MVFSAPSEAGRLTKKGFSKLKPVNMNDSSKGVIKKTSKNKKWKAKKNVNSKMVKNRNNNTVMVMENSSNNALAMVTMPMASNALPMAVSHFITHPPSFLQGRPIEPFFMRKVPLDTRFKSHGHAITPRKGPKKRRILSRKKAASPFLHAPLAPHNTTSFIMRAKKLGGIAPAVTPSPAASTVFTTPLLSPGVRDKGSLEEMNRELGLDGYGSMNGLIRLRSHQDKVRDGSDTDESDVEVENLMNEEHVHSVERLEQRIDEGLSRFEMIYPSHSMEIGSEPRNLQNCVIYQECRITCLEEENLALKERLVLVEQELKGLRQRARELEGFNAANEPREEHCEDSCGDVLAPFE